MQDAYAQSHPTIAARKNPGIAVGSKLTAHNQVEFVLGIIRCIHIIFGPVAITMEGLTHRGTHAHMSREATCIDGDSGPQGIALIDMIFNSHATDAIIFHESLLNCMIYREDGTGSHPTARKVLVDAAHMYPACDPWRIVERHLAIWSD